MAQTEICANLFKLSRRTYTCSRLSQLVAGQCACPSITECHLERYCDGAMTMFVPGGTLGGSRVRD
jgi:hypothetical protein